jgi:hypothetical protein
MCKIRNETIRIKMEVKKDMLKETEEQQVRWCCHSMRMEDCRIARQVAERTPQGKGGAAEQPTHGRMGLGTASKAETSRLKNISIKISGGNELYLWVEENCFHRKKL